MGTYTKYETDTWSSVKVMGWKEKIIMNYFEGGQTEQENLKRRPLYFALHEGGGLVEERTPRGSITRIRPRGRLYVYEVISKQV